MLTEFKKFYCLSVIPLRATRCAHCTAEVAAAR